MNYKVIEIFTSENARWHGKSIHEAILEVVRKQKLAARCLMTRALAGCYENGEVATWKIEILSFNMPLKIEVILPTSQADTLLPTIQEMVLDGIVGVRDLSVASHRTQKHLLPKHLLVRDVMTCTPKTVSADTPASEVVRLLLSANYNGVPVVDDAFRPIGIITQGDLIARAGMPVRLGLLGAMNQENLDTVLQNLQARKAAEIMTRPVATIAEDQPLMAAVDLMLTRNLKRLPVVDASGRLAGILARWDVFRTITTETPDWKALQEHKIVLVDVNSVQDIMQRDTHTVLATATLEEVMRVIDSNDLQRVAVVDDTDRLLGMISDHDLLRLFSGHKIGVWDRIASRLTFTEMGMRHKIVMEQAQKRTAGQIMKTDLVTIQGDAPIEEAIRLMTTHQIKRLPVVDSDAKFKGMVSRDSLLRAGLDNR
jgi:CBS domain-containing protein